MYTLKLWLIMLIFVTIVHGSGAQRVLYSTKKLKKNKCSKHEKVRKGDEVTILLSASVLTAAGDFHESESPSEQKFIVGRHNIPPINSGIVGMCLGDKRLVTIRVEQSPGAVSDPMKYVVTLVSNSGGAPRIKEYIADL